MRSRSPAVFLCFSLVVPLAMPGCGTSAASKDGAKSPLAADAAEGGAPHVFTPRAHPPRDRPAPPQPDIAALPAMIDRTSECFAGPIAEEPPRIAKPQPTRKRAKGPSKSAKKK